MGRAGPQFLQSGNMLGGAVALMLLEMITGVEPVQLFHLTVTGHLGNDGSGGDGIAYRITVNDAPFFAV